MIPHAPSIARYLRFCLLAASGLLLTACQAERGEGDAVLQIQGSLTYLQRIALPEDAVITVRLLNISLADAPAEVLAEQRIETEGAQVPIPFTLQVPRAKLDTRPQYSVSARIEDGQNNLLWITGSNHPIDPNLSTINMGPILLTQVVSAPPSAADYFRATGNEPFWLLEISKADEQIVFTYDLGESKAVVPLPEKIQESHGTVYRAQTEAHTLEVTIQDKLCVDSMSGREFPNTVSVVLDGESYSGCGEVRSIGVD